MSFEIESLEEDIMEDFSDSLDSIIQDDYLIHVKDIEIEEEKFIPMSSGYYILDEAMAGGFRPGNLIIITGKPSCGKTAWMMNLCINISNNGGFCEFFSYEITNQELKQKFLEMQSDLSNLKLYTPKKMTTGSLKWIKNKIIKAKQDYSVKYIFIDHIDFLTPTNLSTGDQLRIKLKQIATELKSLANELEVCIFLIAHTRKTNEGADLQLEDIGESAGMGQLADYVFSIKRNIKTNPDGSKVDEGSVVNILKNRKTGNMTNFLKYKMKNNRTIIIKNEEQIYGQDQYSI